MKMSAGHEIKAMSNVGGGGTMYRYTHIINMLTSAVHACIARQHELSHLLLTLGYTIETCSDLDPSQFPQSCHWTLHACFPLAQALGQGCGCLS